MTPDAPDDAQGNAALSHAAAAPEGTRSAPSPRMRLAGALLLIACLLAMIGAGLPWLTAINVQNSSGFRTRLFTWFVWNTQLGVFFLLFLIPLFFLLRAGLAAVRGLPPRLRRRSAVLLSLAGCAGTVGSGLILFIAAVLATFNPYWGRLSQTDLVVESGFYVSLASYALAMIASVVLPARAST